MLAFKDLAKRARGIIIILQMLRGGLVLGGTVQVLSTPNHEIAFSRED